MKRCLKILLSIIAIVCTVGPGLSNIQAGEYRHHEAHEHGVAHMNVAVEEDHLFIEFMSPSVNLIGFEHHPRTEEQKVAVQNAIATLKSGEMLFGFPSGADGELTQSTVETDILSHDEQQSEASHHHEHGTVQEAEEEHQHAREGENESHEHGHEHHSDFRAEYRFDFNKPQELNNIHVKLFQVFPAIERIEVQLLTGTKQTALELTVKNTKIAF